MIWSLLLGFAIGWVASMPVAGAVSIFVCRRGFAGRYDHGLALAAGAALIEAGWCLAILFGAGELLDYWPRTANVAEILGSLLLVGLGPFFFFRRQVAGARPSPATTSSEPACATSFAWARRWSTSIPPFPSTGWH